MDKLNEQIVPRERCCAIMYPFTIFQWWEMAQCESQSSEGEADTASKSITPRKSKVITQGQGG